MNLHALAMIFIQATAAVGSDRLPPILKEAIAARAQLQTGLVEYEWDRPALAGSSEGRVAAVGKYLDRFCPERGWIQLMSPAMAGNQEATASDVPRDRGQPTALYSMVQDGLWWRHSDRSLEAQLEQIPSSEASDHPDFRALGLSTNLLLGTLERVLDEANLPEPWQFSQIGTSGIVQVTGRSGPVTATWSIDTDRGFAPVAVRWEMSESDRIEVRSELAEFDGAGYPSAVACFRSSYKDGAEPCDKVKIIRAEFNRPEHPRHFLPKDIGVVAGMTVKLKQADRFYDYFAWSGQELLTREEWLAKQEKGEVQAHPLVEELREESNRRIRQDPDGYRAALARQLSPGADRFESYWEYYVRRFVEQHQLSTEQAQAAHRILRDCQEQARSYCKSMSLEFRRLDSELAEIREKVPPPPLERLQQFDQKVRELIRPIDRIFKDSLKPRLEKVPTRAQLATAAQAATSRPAIHASGH